MEDDRGRLVVIVAGYEEEMRRFLASNPGLESRFGEIIRFIDFDAPALVAIFKELCAKSGYELEAGAAEVAERRVTDGWRQRKRHFGNGRVVRRFFEEAVQCQAVRLATTQSDLADRATLSLLTTHDIPAGFGESNGDDGASAPDSLPALLHELDSLIGLQAVKEQVKRVANLVLVQDAREKAGLKVGDVSHHIVFLGAPGTGKTTVARLVGRVYKAIGLLPRGHVVEVARQDLVAGYIGQTATRTNDVIDQALGGVLFIDEAYALSRPEAPQDFGREAVETLLKRMEDDRGRFVVIAAGYEAEMEGFLRSNPGLLSRFVERIRFADYTPDELMRIFQQLAVDHGYEVSPDAQRTAAIRTADGYAHRTAAFANGRTIRNFFEAAVANQATRIAKLDLTDTQVLQRIEASDLPATL
jgi:AAA+ superfamily predicted ATPase